MPTDADIDNNGLVSASELETSGQLLELQLREEKAETQKNMAWTAIISMIIFTAVLFSPLISDSKVAILSDLVGLFYVAQASVVGAYMGVTAWLSKSVNANMAGYQNTASYQNTAAYTRYANVASARQVPQPVEPIL